MSYFNKVVVKKKKLLIASFATWYHYLGICSYVRFNISHFDTVLLVSQEALGKQNFVDEKIIEKYVDNSFIVNDLEALRNKLHHIDIANREVVIASTSKYPYRLAKLVRDFSDSFDVVCYEEGIGTYSSFFKHISAQVRESSIEYSFLKLISFLKFGASWILKYLYFFRVKKNCWLNFDKKTLSINADVVGSYKAVISDIDFEGATKIDLLPGSVIFLSAPLCEIGVMSQEDYIDRLVVFFKGYSNVYVKPHPIEDVGKYKDLGFLIVETDLPYELWVGAMCNRYDTYSFSSTCVYTSFLLLDTKVFRVSSIDYFYNSLSIRQKKIIDKCSLSF